MADSPLQRTIKLFAEYGWITDRCRAERWVKFGKADEEPGQRKGFGKSPGHREDLWGFADLVLLNPEPPKMAAINACAYTGISEHVGTILGDLPRSARQPKNVEAGYLVNRKRMAKLKQQAADTYRNACILERLGVFILVVGWRKLKEPRLGKLWHPRIVRIAPASRGTVDEPVPPFWQASRFPGK